VTRQDIERFRDWMLAEGRRRGGKPGTPLGPRSVRLTLGRLSAAFEMACRDNRLAVNACQYVRLPSQPERDDTTWTEHDLRRFLAVAADDRLAACWLLSALGLRRGEVLGLKWSDISVSDGTLTIRPVPRPGGRDGHREVAEVEAVVAGPPAVRADDRRAGSAPGTPAGRDGCRLSGREAESRPVHHPETSALMMRRDDQTNDQDDRSGRKYQDHCEDVLEDPVLAYYPLPVLQRHPGLGRMIARGRIVQVESSAAPAEAVSWVPSRATNPNHHASRRPGAPLWAV